MVTSWEKLQEKLKQLEKEKRLFITNFKKCHDMRKKEDKKAFEEFNFNLEMAYLKKRNKAKSDWLTTQEQYTTIADVGSVKLSINGTIIYIPFGEDGSPLVYIVSKKQGQGIPSYYKAIMWLKNATIGIYWKDTSDTLEPFKTIQGEMITIYKMGYGVIIEA